MAKRVILAIDQGTSGSKAVLFDTAGVILARATVPLESLYPSPGFVEQEPEEIIRTVVEAVRLAVNNYTSGGGEAADIVCCGISNQRETFLLWDGDGQPYSKAVVWQCKRSVQVCERLKADDVEEELNRRTGLIIDPYFSGTKLVWLKENRGDIARAIGRSEVFFGTVDSWLLYRLSRERSYATDYTNASRTLFMNLNDLSWDSNMLSILGLEGLRLPALHSSSSLFGHTDFDGILPEAVPITGMIGDSHAAAFGEHCFDHGTAKATLGTGSSILMNAGPIRPRSTNGLVSTICWSAGERVDYALEGIIVSCGSTITWLRDQLGFFSESRETEEIAASVPDNGGVCLIPAFAGLGAPYWKMDQRGLITGLTFGSGRAHIVRAGLESVAYQVKDVISTMENDAGRALTALRVDGGLTANDFVMNLMADLLGVSVEAIELTEASALGAAFLAGLGAGVFGSIEEIAGISYNSVNYKPVKGRNSTAGYQMWKDQIGRL
jgi:glycerol kinase